MRANDGLQKPPLSAAGASHPRATVTVVIPVKDDAMPLDACLSALANQTFMPDEIIVVDNDSSDHSADVAARHGARVLRCMRPGIPAASSHGYDHATGDLILRLDADCVPSHTWVEAMVTAFADHPDVDAFTGGARFIDGPRPLRLSLAVLYLGAYAAVTAPALGHLPLFGSNMAMRAQAWRGVKNAVCRDDAEVHDDLDLAFHLGAGRRIRYVREASMGISMRPFGSSRSMAVRVARGFRTVGVHWPHDFPPFRVARRVTRRTGLSSEVSR